MSPVPAHSDEKRERSDMLQTCLAKLTPIHREVINLTYYQGQKIEEVARSTGAPVATIKTRLHYALRAAVIGGSKGPRILPRGSQ